jgi:hypothetical protein
MITDCLQIDNVLRGTTKEMPENVHLCNQKAAAHSHFIRSTPIQYQSVTGIESYPKKCTVLCGVLR